MNISKNHLIKCRKTFLFGEINNKSVLPVIQDLIYFNKSKEDVFLYICSPGGYVDAGMSLIDIMNLMSYNINTIVANECCSMAAIVAICGTKGKRYMLKNASLMLHQTSDEIEGTTDDLENYLKEFKKSQETLYKIIAKQTGKTIEQIRKDINKKDLWMNSNTAIKYKAIDRIWTKTLEAKSNKIKE